MAKHRRKARTPERRAASEIRVHRATEDGAWEFLHPRCALERADDMEEVASMLAAGEVDIAVEELRWLLSGCSDFITAHRRLGELALAGGDLDLARGHFGHAFRVGIAALKRAGQPRPLPYAREANRDFFECGKGLAHCLFKLKKEKLAAEVIKQLLDCDPSDPLNVRSMPPD